MTKQIALKIDSIKATRVDIILLEALKNIQEFKDLTRSQLSKWIAQGFVEVDGVKVNPGSKIKGAHTVNISMPQRQTKDLAAYPLKLEVLHEDASLIVLNKPAGLSMHPGAGNRSTTLVNALKFHWGTLPEAFAGERPGIVHRLDKDTTGVVVVAKTLSALESLAKQFRERTVVRSYVALVLSTPRSKRLMATTDEGVIKASLARHPKNRLKFAVIEGGRDAITKWRVLERFNYGTLVELKLGTGRTHQIRVHMEFIGSPVIGDQLYGDFTALPKKIANHATEFGRQALHAKELEFLHPTEAKRLRFESKIPEDFCNLIEAFRCES